MAFDEAWKHHTSLGNRAFERKDHKSADAHYGLASEEAERIFELAVGGAEIPTQQAAALLLVSAVNQSANKTKSGEPRSAQAVLETLLSSLCLAIENDSIPFPVRRACLDQLNHALFEVIETMKQTKEKQSAIDAVVDRTKTTALSFIHNHLLSEGRCS